MENGEVPLRNINPNIEDGNIDHILLQRNDPELTHLVIGSEEEDAFLPHDEDWAKVGECLGRNDHVSKLTISLMDGDERKFELLCKGLAQNKSIKEVEIYHDLCDGLGHTSLIPFFQNNTLERLSIEDDDHTSDNKGTLLLASALATFSSLQEFSFRMGFIPDYILQDVLEGLSRHHGLKMLALREVNDLDRHEFSWVATLLQNTKSCLSKLSITGTGGIDDHGLVALAVALAGNGTLKELELSFGESITETSIMALSHALQSPHIRIEGLFLKGFLSLGIDVEDYLVKGLLANNTHFVSLGLDDNQDEANWGTISTYLRSNMCHLQHLSLSRCALTDGNLIPIINSLFENNALKLKSLNLDHNHSITTRSWRAMATFLRDPRCLLEKLSVEYIPTNGEIAHIMADSLVNNRRLEELNIGMSSAGYKAFAQLLYPKTNIVETHLSNHKLHTLGGWIRHSGHLSLALKINREFNNKDAARQKIMRCLFHCDYNLPLSDMESNVLPHLLAWLGRTERNGVIDVSCGISLVYQVVQVTPTLFSFISKSKKRKLSGQ